MFIFKFVEPSSVDKWRSVDDRVMGGVSSSEMVWSNEHASFTGVVSPENNGGFCSIRAALDASLSPQTDHLFIESRGDQKRYSLSLRTNKAFDGINYQASFNSTEKFTRIEFPLVEFQAQFRGRVVVDAPELRGQDIVQIGIVISDAQYGEFQLDVKSIGSMP